MTIYRLIYPEKGRGVKPTMTRKAGIFRVIAQKGVGVLSNAIEMA
jgi:hypothetical protein